MVIESTSTADVAQVKKRLVLLERRFPGPGNHPGFSDSFFRTSPSPIVTGCLFLNLGLFCANHSALCLYWCAVVATI